MKPSPNKGRSFERCCHRSNEHVIYPHPSATSTYARIFGSASLSAASSPWVVGLLCGFCTSPDGAWRECGWRRCLGDRFLLRSQWSASLTTHSRTASPRFVAAPRLSSPRTVFFLLLHLGIMPFKEETETKYRGLTPHKITPMSGVLHTEPRAARLFLLASLSPRPCERRRYPTEITQPNDRHLNY